MFHPLPQVPLINVFSQYAHCLPYFLIIDISYPAVNLKLAKLLLPDIAEKLCIIHPVYFRIQFSLQNRYRIWLFSTAPALQP